ncbi:Octopine transport system permease protein OccQ [Hartmannibacter diazotrophicus]|uniref:Octopine transport system permease protein OccQ n=1 Tax=Hartmannibacter diazotrophicus TaxID=1482074 RepID=A0A2C9D5R2_9HYPH|nr:ABC transporter permease subunit [Hartmannibacter diazotrophicus]SON55672.1 Octopine transport system permease protein OccQ [Hartmannibacter diazotrophicus]
MEITSPEFWGYINQMANGAWVTIELFVSGFTLAFILGTVVGIISLSRNVVIQAIWRTYASIMMGVPSLLVIFILYYGGSAILSGIFGTSRIVDVTPFGAGLAALTLVYAAYVAELVHGAVRNLPRGQFEACSALSIRPHWAWYHVILPQVFRLALPGLVNIWLIVLKDTPLVSLAGLNDLVATAKISAGATKEPFIFFIAASLFFIAFSALSMPLATRLEARLGRGIAKVKT